MKVSNDDFLLDASDNSNGYKKSHDYRVQGHALAVNIFVSLQFSEFITLKPELQVVFNHENVEINLDDRGK